MGQSEAIRDYWGEQDGGSWIRESVKKPHKGESLWEKKKKAVATTEWPEH